MPQLRPIIKKDQTIIVWEKADIRECLEFYVDGSKAIAYYRRKGKNWIAM